MASDNMPRPPVCLPLTEPCMGHGMEQSKPGMLCHLEQSACARPPVRPSSPPLMLMCPPCPKETRRGRYEGVLEDPRDISPLSAADPACFLPPTAPGRHRVERPALDPAPLVPLTTGRAATGREYPTAPGWTSNRYCLPNTTATTTWSGHPAARLAAQRPAVATDPGAGAPRFRYPAAAPSPQQTELDPAAEKKQQVIDDFRKAVCLPHQQAGDAKLQEGASSRCWPRAPAPPGLPTSSPANSCPPRCPGAARRLLPNQLSNQTLAKQIAQASIPTLDLYQEEGGRWPRWRPKPQARAAAATSSTTAPMP